MTVRADVLRDLARGVGDEGYRASLLECADLIDQLAGRSGEEEPSGLAARLEGRARELRAAMVMASFAHRSDLANDAELFEQAASALREWKVEADRSKWPKEAAQEFFRLRAAAPLLLEQRGAYEAALVQAKKDIVHVGQEGFAATRCYLVGAAVARIDAALDAAGQPAKAKA